MDAPFVEAVNDGEFAEESQERRPKVMTIKGKNMTWKLPIPQRKENSNSDAIDSKMELQRVLNSRNESRDTTQSIAVVTDNPQIRAGLLDDRIIESVEGLGVLLYEMRESKGFLLLGFKTFTDYVRSVAVRTGKSKSSMWGYLREAIGEDDPLRFGRVQNLNWTPEVKQLSNEAPPDGLNGTPMGILKIVRELVEYLEEENDPVYNTLPLMDRLMRAWRIYKPKET